MLPTSYLDRIKNRSLQPHEVACLDCINPQIISAYNSDIAKTIKLAVPCGKCIRCSDNLRNEWATRMCLHSLGYKWCYYVTLTYGTYNLHPYKIHPFKQNWLNTAPQIDNHNYNHRFSYTPSLLIHSHLTDYIKRLRIQTKCELSYCACGEYGSHADNGEDKTGFGRPHFHLIVWTDKFLTQKDFALAWSYDCAQLKKDIVVRWNGKQDPSKRFTFRIGHVDFENLTLSGALDWNGVNKNYQSRSNTSSRNCFSYVAKYVGKRNQIPQNALNRIDRVFALLPFSDKYDPYEGIAITDPLLKTTTYLPPADFVRRPHDFKVYKKVLINKKYYESITLEEFRQIVSPFFVSSRTYAIGKRYALQNLDRLSRGSYKLPKFQGKRLAFPRYFARLVSQKKYPIRLRQDSVLCRSLVKGSLPRLYEYYDHLRETRDYYYYAKSLIRSSPSLYATLGDTTKLSNLGHLYDVTLVYPDVNVRYEYIAHNETFEGYVYNKHSREYDLYDVVPREDFCDLVLSLINDRWETMDDSKRELQLELIDCIKNDPITSDAIDVYLATRLRMQNMYKRDHKFKNDKQ